MKKPYKDTSLIVIKVGEKVKRKEDSKIGTLMDISLTPNGINDSSLVCILVVKYDDGRISSSTSDKFEPADDVLYEEQYPTVNMFKFDLSGVFGNK